MVSGAPPRARAGELPPAHASHAALSDGALTLFVAAALFALVAWPLLFLRVPPYQDLPGHLAAVTILANPDLYPELVPTGFLKPNSFFFLFTLSVGKKIGILLAAKIFALGVLAANAWAFPRFVLHFTDRRRMLLASVFLVPMVHNWFVSMGMLNFAASIPVAMLLVVELDRARADPRARSAGARAAVLALVSWYLHPFPVLVVSLMVAAAGAGELLDRRRGPLSSRLGTLRAMLPPLVPAALLSLFVLARHVAAAPKMDGAAFSTPGWSIYNLWGQWTYGFTELTAISVVPAIVLALAAAVRWREGPAILGPLPLVTLLTVYAFGPYVAFDANYIAPRFIPFVWAALLVRIPPRLPRALVGALGASAAVYVAGMSVDLFRLSRELDDFAAGAAHLPDGARILPLNFNARPTSKNTFSLATAWGLYVVERHTSAIDAWANVPSMPILRRAPLPPQLESMTRLRFVESAATPERLCASRRARGLVTGDCERLWREEWDRFWSEALPGFDFVLLWDPPAELGATLPPMFRESFVRGRLHLFARSP